MAYTGIKFSLRLKTTAKLHEVAKNVEDVLNFKFSDSEDLEGNEILIGNVMGLKVNLAFNWNDVNDSRRACQFVGHPNYDIAGSEFEDLINISTYLTHYLNVSNTEEWYVPTMDELMKDAGLD
jgi:hypothetical protein